MFIRAAVAMRHNQLPYLNQQDELVTKEMATDNSSQFHFIQVAIRRHCSILTRVELFHRQLPAQFSPFQSDRLVYPQHVTIP